MHFNYQSHAKKKRFQIFGVALGRLVGPAKISFLKLRGALPSHAKPLNFRNWYHFLLPAAPKAPGHCQNLEIGQYMIKPTKNNPSTTKTKAMNDSRSLNSFLRWFGPHIIFGSLDRNFTLLSSSKACGRLWRRGEHFQVMQNLCNYFRNWYHFLLPAAPNTPGFCSAEHVK